MQLLVSNVQFIFGSLDKPTKFSEAAEPKFFGKFLASNDNTISTIEAAIKKTASDKFNTVSKKLADFIFEPDLDKYPEQEGSIVFNASNQDKPTLFNRQGEVIQAEDGKICRGCFVNVKLSLWAWSHKGKEGVSSNLLGIQFFATGTPLGNTASASDFENYGPEDDGPQNYSVEQIEDIHSPLG